MRRAYPMTEVTILLVDDDETTRATLRRWLTHLQVRGQVLEAADGQVALALLDGHCQATTPPVPLLVLLDLQMPVMDGLEFLASQRQFPLAWQQAMTVVVLSGAHETADCQRARALVAEVKNKPLDIKELMTLLQYYLPGALPS
ncbi:MAG: response regulator [Hymenobacter sp.]|nr:MAG: response regulator [Hymenobacter sp.]